MSLAQEIAKRYNRPARTALSVMLSVSLVFTSGPSSIIQAYADEMDDAAQSVVWQDAYDEQAGVEDTDVQTDGQAPDDDQQVVSDDQADPQDDQQGSDDGQQVDDQQAADDEQTNGDEQQGSDDQDAADDQGAADDQQAADDQVTDDDQQVADDQQEDEVADDQSATSADAEDTAADDQKADDEKKSEDEKKAEDEKKDDEAKDEASTEATVLTDENDAASASVTIDPSVELPEGAHVQLTVLHNEAAELEEATTSQGNYKAAEDVANNQTQNESESVTGTDAVLADLTEVVNDQLPSDADAVVVSDAYVVELLDADDAVVPVEQGKAIVELTLKGVTDEAALADSYTVARDTTAADDTVAVATSVDTEFETQAEATDALGTATEASVVDTDQVKADEETGDLIISMEIDEVLAVITAPAVKGIRPANSPGAVLTDDQVAHLSGKGFTVNLFNYDAYENPNATWRNPWTGQLEMDNQIGHPRADGINSVNGTNATMRPFLFFNGGTQTNPVVYNSFGGMTATPVQRVVANELVEGADGNFYPQVPVQGQTPTSLEYLFNANDKNSTGSDYVNGKSAYMDVDGLFQQDNRGYYTYDSNKNYAYYDTNQTGDNKKFTLYADTYQKSNTDPYCVGYFPFNQWNRYSTTNVQPSGKDHHFGTSMHGTFVIPEDPNGQVTFNGQKNDMLFEMGGDDDMFVFIDGVLVLDLGGIHQPVHGSIDFTHNKVNIIGDPLNNRYRDVYQGTTPQASIAVATDTDPNSAKVVTYDQIKGDIYHSGELLSNKGYYQTSIDAMFGLVGKSWSEIATPGSSHTIDVFYLERGSYDSNLLMRFNLPLTPTTELTVEKDWQRNNALETNHSDGLYVQLYQQRKLSDGSYTDPKPYGDPVPLSSSTDPKYTYTYTGLPVHAVEEIDAYYYTVKEGYIMGGNFVPFGDGDIVSDGAVYSYVSTTYAYGDGTTSEVDPDDENAAFHHGNDENKVGTATILNKRMGAITAEKEWLNQAGVVETDDHGDDSIVVALYKQTKASSATNFDNATETRIATQVLDESNNWYCGFDDPEIENNRNNPNVRFVVYEGTLEGGAFTKKEVIDTVSMGQYQHDSTTYTRTVIKIAEGETTVEVVDRTTAEYRNRNSKELYWQVDHPDGDTRYWLNRRYGTELVELEMQHNAEPQRYVDSFTQTVYIPYSAADIPDDPSYDFVVDAILDSNGTGLVLDSVTVSGTSIAPTYNADGSYTLRVPAAWAKEHPGEAIQFTYQVSTPVANPRQSLQDIAGFNNRAIVRTIPTDYVVAMQSGYSYAGHDAEWPPEDGIQLTTGGTGHALITNRPVTTIIEVEKEWADGESAHANDSVWVQLYHNGEAEGTPVELKAGNWSHVFSNLVTEGQYTVKEGTYDGTTFTEFGATFEMNNGKLYKQYATTYYDADNTKLDVAYLDGTVVPHAGSVTFVNGPVVGKVKLHKVDADDDTVSIEGATFILVKDAGPLDENDLPVYNATGDHVRVPNSTTSFVTDEDGMVTLSDLEPGDYWLIETAAPTGFILRDPAHPICIRVSDLGVATVLADSSYDTSKTTPLMPAEVDDDGNLLPTQVDSDGYQTLTVPNVRNYELPAAGGPGVYPFLLVGTFAAAYALSDSDEWRKRLARAAASGRSNSAR